MLTQEKLKEFLDYDPETGIFTYIKTVNSRALEGQTAGRVQSSGHLRIQINKKDYQLHHLAFLYMLGYLPKEVDHINHVADDNSWKNLRECNRTQNSYNSSIRSDNTSGIKGVSWHKKLQRWRVRLWVNGRETSFGTFANLEDAAFAADEARRKYHGEFAHG